MKMLLVTAVLAASIASAHATTFVAPFIQSVTIDGQTYEGDLSLARDQRTVDLTITKHDSKGEIQVFSGYASTLVAMKKYNDHPKLFGLPFEVTRTLGYPVKLTVDGNDVEVPQTIEGVSAVVYLSDTTPTLGTASVHLKVLPQSLFGKEENGVDETVDFVLNEGANVKTVGAYTLTVTVRPVQTTSTASL